MALEAAKTLIAHIQDVSEQQWIKEMKRIWQLHPVEGPVATLYVLNYVQKTPAEECSFGEADANVQGSHLGGG